MNIELSITSELPRVFKAKATANGRSAYGEGSSEEVAASRAVKTLVIYGKGDKQPTPQTPATDKQYYIRSGKRAGQTCFFVKIVAELEDTEVWEMEYSDNTRGREKSKFLEAVKK